MRSVSQMLAALEPHLLPDDFVFCCLPNASLQDVVDAAPIATFVEPEGLTAVLPRKRALQAGLEPGESFCCITLGLSSGLDEIGLTAAVSAALAEQGISANVIAAYHHDHVFVPSARAEEALQVLQGLAKT
ncbi:MAG: ACT domain-containing protein [Halioglobus sp.]